MTTDDEILGSVEADHRALLYKARWDESTAAQIVPQLAKLLKRSDSAVLLRALTAFVYIGPNAAVAATPIAGHLASADQSISETAAIALARVSIRQPSLAVQPLVEMFGDQSRRKYAMFALIELGGAASSAASLFAKAYDSKDLRIRRLALRGLKETHATPEIAVPILQRAQSDASKQIRLYAEKILAAHYSQRIS